MKVDYKGIKQNDINILSLATYLEEANDNQKWEYMGLTVEIDPTIDFSSNNVLIRWTDIDEGFNDKALYYSLHDFQKDFKLLNA